MVPVNLASRCEPGAADFESNSSVHCTGSSAAPAREANTKTQSANRRIISIGLRGNGSAGQLTIGQFGFNPFVDLALGELRRHTNGVLDRVGVGTAVGDDANPLDAEQRSAAVLGIIHALLELLDSRASQQ